MTTYTLPDFREKLREDRERIRKEDDDNKKLVEASASKTFPCIKFSYSDDKYPAPKTEEERHKEVLVAKCPKCENVDNRFMLKHDKDRSSFGVLVTYASSGQDLKCFCCNATFKFCTGDWHEKLNCVPVPLAFIRDELKVNINLYM